MKKQYLTLTRVFGATSIALASLLATPADAAPASRAATKQPEYASDFRALAQQRPRTCQPGTAGEIDTAWPDGEAQCAWQNRLHRTSWSWSAAASPCISTQARWWNRAQAGLPAAFPRSVWDVRWTAQSAEFALGDERRLLVVQHDPAGRWLATEWRWNPNPRPATRRWQEGRWKLLVDQAARNRSRTPGPATPEAAMMQPVFRKALGARPGELGPDGMAMESSGLCLRAGNPLPGQSKLPLSYSADDSRLEQRTAMHLQLSRLHPDAKWLTRFKLMDVPGAPGGAKFLATWIEGDKLTGQLWMPVKGGAPTVRMRVSTDLPGKQSGDASAPAVLKAKQAVEQELHSIAAQWTVTHE